MALDPRLYSGHSVCTECRRTCRPDGTCRTPQCPEWTPPDDEVAALLARVHARRAALTDQAPRLTNTTDEGITR